jgi:L-asparaginase II
MIENSELRAAAERIRDAMANHPYMVAGRGRLCTEVMEATQGRVLAKSGAEGVYALGLVDKNIGFAVKVDDGSSRGYFPVVVQFLLDTGTLEDATAARLESFRRPSIMNQKGEIVGVADLTPEVTFATLFDE